MNNVNKPTIPGEVADAIEYLRGLSPSYSNEDILDFRSGIIGESDDADGIALRSIPFDTLLAALVNGYERELTEEEREAQQLERARAKIKDAYETTERLRHTRYNPASSAYDRGYCAGMIFTLNALDVKISGVNA